MFGFNKDDCDRLITTGDRLKRDYESAQRQFQKALTGWEVGQEKRELLAARIMAIDHTGSHASPDYLMKSREAKLRQQLEAEIRQGDDLIVPLAAAAESAKQALFQCNSTIGGSFGGWASRVISGLPAGTLRDRLEVVRHQVEGMYLGRTGEIIDRVKLLVDEVEADGAVDAPMFRFATLVSRILGKSEGGI